MIDRGLHRTSALLVEGNTMLRSVGIGQLRDLGVGNVTQAKSIHDARALIEREVFDIIVCSRHFEGSSDNGQDLLDELRRENMLPHSTVFLMIVERATYTQVMEAAESALDGILVRPFTSAALSERLQEARNRKRELADILRALDAGHIEVALARAVKRFQEQQPYATYCGRLVGEMLLTLGRNADAKKVFEKLAQGKNLTWARLGIARSHQAAGDLVLARRQIQDVLRDEPGSADGHDLLGRILVEQCEFEAALAEYRQAAKLTPGCLLRRQHAGALAFYQGHAAEALQQLEAALNLGMQSKLFDAMTLLMIAVLRHDRGDASGVAAVQKQLWDYQKRSPDSPRLQRFCAALQVLAGLSSSPMAQAQSATARGIQSATSTATPHEPALDPVQALQQLSDQASDDLFDLETATMVLMLWSRLPGGSRSHQPLVAALSRIGLRFCVSKAITEMLIASARSEDPAQTVLRSSQARVSALAEESMTSAMQGDADSAVRLLLQQGSEMLNTRLLEMARIMTKRHHGHIKDAEGLIEQASAVLARACQSGGHIAGIQRSGRSPGGLQMRGSVSGTAPAAAISAVPVDVPAAVSAAVHAAVHAASTSAAPAVASVAALG